MNLTVLQTDITTVDADAIVNAANGRMLGGGGVDGAIHRAAGPELRAACEMVPEVRPGVRCPTGEARTTPGFKLPAKHVIHTVGPVWNGGSSGEPELLAACYRNVLAEARKYEARTVAFPAISCGVSGYPPDGAAAIAVRTIREYATDDGFDDVYLVAFDEEMAAILNAAARV